MPSEVLNEAFALQLLRDKRQLGTRFGRAPGSLSPLLPSATPCFTGTLQVLGGASVPGHGSDTLSLCGAASGVAKCIFSRTGTSFEVVPLLVLAPLLGDPGGAALPVGRDYEYA